MDKLSLMREYGHIEFELLLHHFEPGQKLVYADVKRRPVHPAFFVLLAKLASGLLSTRVGCVCAYGPSIRLVSTAPNTVLWQAIEAILVTTTAASSLSMAMATTSMEMGTRDVRSRAESLSSRYGLSQPLILPGISPLCAGHEVAERYRCEATSARA
jgi:hypothetical protein